MRATGLLVLGGASLILLGIACKGEVILGDVAQSDAGATTDAYVWPPVVGPGDPYPVGPGSSDPSNNVVPTGGTILTEASDPTLEGATSIAVDAEHVYWTTSGAYGPTPTLGSVMRVPKTGGTRAVVVGDQSRPNAVTRSGDYVYWTVAEVDNPPVYRRLVDGGTIEPIDHVAAYTLLQDDANLYAVGTAIRRISKSDGSVINLFTGATPQITPSALGGGRVFFADLGTRDILAVSADGGAAETVVSRSGNPGFKIAADDTNVYWYNPPMPPTPPTPFQLAIYSAPVGGGIVTKVVDTAGPPDGIYVHDGALYWTLKPAASFQECGGRSEAWPSIQTSPTSGGPVRTIASGYPSAVALTFDETSVYWITGPDGCTPSVRSKVMSAPK